VRDARLLAAHDLELPDGFDIEWMRRLTGASAA
jgi:hypothetical protein